MSTVQKIGKFTFLVGLSVSVLASCGSDRRNFVGLSAQPTEEGHTIAGIRFLNACPTNFVSPEMSIERAIDPDISKAVEGGSPRSALLNGIAGDLVVEAVGIGLQRAKEGLNGSFVAMGAHLGEPEILIADDSPAVSDNDCIVIFHGPTGKSVLATTGDGLDRSILAALKLSDQPAFYLELMTKQEGSGRTMQVNHLQYAGTSAPRAGNGRKTVTVALGLGATGTETPDPTSAAEVYLFNLGQLEVGRSYDGNPSQISVATAKATGAFNLVAQVTESADPSIALEALITAYAANKDSLADAIKEALQ